MVRPLTHTSSSSESIHVSHEVESCCKYCSVLLEIDQITEIDHPILNSNCCSLSGAVPMRGLGSMCCYMNLSASPCHLSVQAKCIVLLYS